MRKQNLLAGRGTRCKDLAQGGAVKLVRMVKIVKKIIQKILIGEIQQAFINVNQHREVCSKGQLPVAI